MDIMKKEYIAPTFEVVEISTNQLLLGSKFSTDDAPVIIPTDEEYNGEFS